MKNIIKGILIGLIISVAAGAGWYFSKSDKLPPRKVYINTHKTELTNYKQLAELKEKQLVQSEGTIFALQAKLESGGKKLPAQKHRADSLEQAYNDNKTIQGCDSTISAKNAVISTQTNKLNGIKILLNEFTNTVSILKDLDTANKLTIDSQDRTIQEQTTEIEANNCCRQWFIEHKFWRWFHRVKCN